MAWGDDVGGFFMGNQDDPGLFGTGTRKVDPTKFQLGAGGQVNMGPQNQFRGQQMDLATALAMMARGQGPSVAQQQLKMGQDRALAQAMALQASQRGPGAAGGARTLAYNQGNINAQAAADAALLRNQEQMGAYNQLGQVLAGARGQDIGLAGQQANLDIQRALAQLQASGDLERMLSENYYKAGEGRQRLWGTGMQTVGSLATMGAGG